MTALSLIPLSAMDALNAVEMAAEQRELPLADIGPLRPWNNLRDALDAEADLMRSRMAANQCAYFQKPANEAYDYHQPCGCALYKLLSENGYSVKDVGSYHWTDTGGRVHWFNEAQHLVHTKTSRAAHDRPWNFGALADRLSS